MLQFAQQKQTAFRARLSEEEWPGQEATAGRSECVNVTAASQTSESQFSKLFHKMNGSMGNNPYTHRLALLVVEAHLGMQPKIVTEFLIKRGRQTFNDLGRACGLPASQLRITLECLLQQNCVTAHLYEENAKTPNPIVRQVYEANLPAIFHRIRFPRFLDFICHDLGPIKGPVAEAIIKNIMHHGRLRFDQVLAATADDHHDNNSNHISKHTVRTIFATLVDRRYLERSPPCNLPLLPPVIFSSKQKKSKKKEPKQESIEYDEQKHLLAQKKLHKLFTDVRYRLHEEIRLGDDGDEGEQKEDEDEDLMMMMTTTAENGNGTSSKKKRKGDQLPAASTKKKRWGRNVIDDDEEDDDSDAVVEIKEDDDEEKVPNGTENNKNNRTATDTGKKSDDDAPIDVDDDANDRDDDLAAVGLPEKDNDNYYDEEETESDEDKDGIIKEAHQQGGGRGGKRGKKRDGNDEDEDDDEDIKETMIDMGPEKTTWRVNCEELDRRLRNDAIVTLIESRYGRPGAVAIAALLDLNAKPEAAVKNTVKTGPIEDQEQLLVSQPFSMEVIMRKVEERRQTNTGGNGSDDGSGDANATSKVIRHALKAMSKRHAGGLLEKFTGRNNEDVYMLNIGEAVDKLRLLHFQTFLSKKFKEGGVRVWNLLRIKGQLEQKQITEAAMLAKEEAREALYALLRAGYLKLQDVPKTADHAPSRTIYTWRAHWKTAMNKFKADMYKSLGNVMIRLKVELTKRASFLEMCEKVTAGNLDPSVLDKRQLAEAKQVTTLLEGSMLRLDEEIALFNWAG